MRIVVGLGNPGGAYQGHRHNVGFMALDRIAERQRLGAWRRRFEAEIIDADIGGVRTLLMKPQTFMNDSGRAVGDAARFYKVAAGDVIVVHDELDLLPGRIKVKAGGGNAGHNGLRSLSSHIGNDYVRLRIGIGHPGVKELVHGYVLHDFARADRDWLEPLLDAIADALPRLLAGDDSRFLTDVARLVAPEPAKQKEPAKAAPAGEARAASRPAHPAGEREAKRRSALAENLERWLGGRKKSD